MLIEFFGKINNERIEETLILSIEDLLKNETIKYEIEEMLNEKCNPCICSFNESVNYCECEGKYNGYLEIDKAIEIKERK